MAAEFKPKSDRIQFKINVEDMDGVNLHRADTILVSEPEIRANRRFSVLKASNSINTDALALYEMEEDAETVKETTMAGFLRSFTIPGTAEREASDRRKSKKLGTIVGVYLPTIQHIFGVLMFLRLFWIVGSMGVLESLFMVVLCCCCTFLTSISMSAIATNGVVESGGSYFMISRNLGPEFGSAVGILFYLANTVATAMYLIGAVELLLIYMGPNLPRFGTSQADMFNNFRIYATFLLLVVFALVSLGVRFVQYFAPVTLFCVIIAICSIYLGSFLATPENSPMICVLKYNDGEMRLLKREAYMDSDGNNYCNSTSWNSVSSPLYNHSSLEATLLDARFEYIPGIPGYASGVIKENAMTYYMKEGQSTKEQLAGEPKASRFEVVQDMSTTFFVLLAIYFPSVTGIMTGSNMSGDLKDPQRSIPLGTIAAQLTTTFVYITFIFVFGGTIVGPLLRDKYGQSLGHGTMVVAALAWPHEYVLLIGSFTSTFGAGMQCLCSAPRLLQSIAKDNVIPFLAPFSVVTKRNEPFRALLITTVIAECAILIGNLDHVAPVVDFFFLMCYCFVNIVCAMQTIMKAPNWRPRFRFYHWTLSLIGAALCLFIMFATHWHYAIIVTVLCAIIYKYVEYKGAKKEWGDGMRGLALSTAQYSLLRVEDRDPHPKNWRPQLLLLVKPDDELKVKYERMLTLATQLKAGKGLTIVVSLMEGDFGSPIDRLRAEELRQTLKRAMKEERCRGFAKVVVTEHPSLSVSTILQSAGIGGLRPNTIVIGWPYSWADELKNGNSDYWKFIEAVHRVALSDMCLLIPKGLELFPAGAHRQNGTIDVWWIMHDGGLLILLPFLLKQHKVWRHCKIRVFAVAQMQDNSIKMKNDLEQWCYQLRIDASVEIVEMTEKDVSAYAYEKTMLMEERANYLKNLNLSMKQELSQTVQPIDTSTAEIPQKRPKTKSLLSLAQRGQRIVHKRTASLMVRKTSTKRQNIRNHGSSSSVVVEHHVGGRPRGSSVLLCPQLLLDQARYAKTDSDVDIEMKPVSLKQLASSMMRSTKKPAGDRSSTAEDKELIEMKMDDSDEELLKPMDIINKNQFTFTPANAANIRLYGNVDTLGKKSEGGSSADLLITDEIVELETEQDPQRREELKAKIHKRNIKKMHTAVSLNKVVKSHSSDAQLVVLNLPKAPRSHLAFPNYLQYIEVLTEGLERVLLVRGTGREVITIYS